MYVWFRSQLNLGESVDRNWGSLCLALFFTGFALSFSNGCGLELFPVVPHISNIVSLLLVC